MEPMCSAELDSRQEKMLLDVAFKSIQYGLDYGREMVIDVNDFPPPLREKRATFVTLKTNHELQGCIGTLEAHRQLVTDVCANAYAAAFSEPLELHFQTEVQLLGQLRPGIDGVILQQGSRRGTFLPSVWNSLPEKQKFLAQLKVKAGLSPDYWSDDIRAYHYTTHVIGEDD